MWFARNFKVISIQQAVKWGLSFSHNIHGDLINYLNCRSVWVDDKKRNYRVKQLLKQ